MLIILEWFVEAAAVAMAAALFSISIEVRIFTASNISTAFQLHRVRSFCTCLGIDQLIRTYYSR